MAKQGSKFGSFGNGLTVPNSLRKLTIDDLSILIKYAENTADDQETLNARKLLSDPKVKEFQYEIEQFLVRRQARQGQIQPKREMQTRSTAFNQTSSNIDTIKRGASEIQKEDRKESTQNQNITTQKNSTMKKRLLLADAIQGRLSNRTFDKDWLDVFTQANDDLRNAGLAHLPGRNTMVIPIQERAVIAAETGLVPVAPLYGLPPAGEETTMAKAGATVVTGFIGNAIVPSFSSIIAGWLGQNEENTNDPGALLYNTLSPLRIQAWVDISRQLISMGGPSVSDFIINGLKSATAAKLEATVLGVAARSAVQPQGMGYKVTTGNLTKKASLVPTFGDILNMEGEVASLKALQGKLGYITSGKGKHILKYNRVEPGQPEPLLKNGLMNDHPVFISNWAADNAGSDGLGSLLVFGPWSDLLICQFGAYLITIDAVSQARNNKVRIYVDSFWEVRGMRFGAYTTGAGTDSDEYHGFSSLPIKLS